MKLRSLNSASGSTTAVHLHIFLPRVGLAVVESLAKFRERSFIHSRNSDGVYNFKKGHVTKTTPLSRENFYCPYKKLRWCRETARYAVGLLLLARLKARYATVAVVCPSVRRPSVISRKRDKIDSQLITMEYY